MKNEGCESQLYYGHFTRPLSGQGLVGETSKLKTPEKPSYWTLQITQIYVSH